MCGLRGGRDATAGDISCFSHWIDVYAYVFTFGDAFLFCWAIPAMLTALLLPLLSGAITGMPPFYPPIAFIMSIELATMCGIIAYVRVLFPKLHELIIFIPILLVGRCIGVGLIYLMALLMKLPAKFIAGVSLLSGWPGIILMIVAIPAIIRISRMVGHSNIQTGNEDV